MLTTETYAALAAYSRTNAYTDAVARYEAEGLCTSDAQACVESDYLKQQTALTGERGINEKRRPSPCSRCAGALDRAGRGAAMKTVNIVKIYMVKEGSVEYGSQVTNARDVAALARRFIGAVDREHCIVICLDNKHRPASVHTVSIGSLTSSVVHPREVFKPAILSSAAAVVLAHNHPSGDPLPSAEDRTITTRLVDAGQVLGIAVIDHVIIGDNDTFYSFAEHRLIHQGRN